jgi:hypothetical protein
MATRAALTSGHFAGTAWRTAAIEASERLVVICFQANFPG